MKLSDLRCVNENINIKEYIEFRDLVKENMDHPDWLGDFDEDKLEILISIGSKIWMYYYNEEVVCSMMFIPASKEDMDKCNIDLDYNLVAEYGPMFVNPKYIGNKLQYQMLKDLDNYCMNINYKYAFATVHPDNIYSKNNLFKDDFYYHSTMDFKRGTRDILLKEYKHE